MCVNNGGVFPYPVSAGNGSASGTLYNNSGGIVYIYGVFNSGGNISGSVNNDSGVVNGSNLVFSGTVTSAGQTILSTTEVALNDGDFVTWSLSKQDTLSSGATLRLGYALSIAGAVTNIAEDCVVPPTTTTTTTTTTAAPTTTTTTTTTSSTSTTTTAAPLPANIQITNGSLDVAVSQVDFNGVTTTYVAGQPLPNTTGNGTDLNTTQIGTYTLDVYRNNSVAGQHITVTDSNGTPQCIFFSSGAATESYFGVVYDGVTNIQIDVQDGSC